MKKMKFLIALILLSSLSLAFSFDAFSQNRKAKKQTEDKQMQSIHKENNYSPLVNSSSKRGGGDDILNHKALVKMTPSDAPSSNSVGRICAAKTPVKPYSISRKNFNNLPADRQQFILSNLNKYSIED